jgi:REP-associated tyrosine transposase
VPRKPRLQAADVLYHVSTRGVEKRDIFLGTRSYLSFLSILEETVRRYGWICHAYCLMGNHYHLLVETPRANISLGMQHLNSAYATWFNIDRRREGALYERRFRDVVAKRDAHLLELCRYVVLNPVRAGWRRHPEDWLWSSYNATIGLVACPPFLSVEPTLALFGGGRTGAGRYAEFVADGIVLARPDMSDRDMSGSDPDMADPDMAPIDMAA